MHTHTPFMIALAQSGFFNEIIGQKDLISRVDTARQLEKLTTESTEPVNHCLEVPEWATHRSHLYSSDREIFFDDTHYQYVGNDCRYPWGEGSLQRDDIQAPIEVNVLCKPPTKQV